MSEGKLNVLLYELRKHDNAIIAFSGGVDSTLLVTTAKISGITFMAVTSNSETMPLHDLENAIQIASSLGIEHRIVKTRELSDRNFSNNPPERCFYCKDNLFNLLSILAAEEGYDYILDGSNADDAHDYRPGLRANKKHGIISPLMRVGLSKSDVRELSRELHLSSWDSPSSPCLSSRFPYGEKITLNGITMVARAEDFLRSLGFRIIRVRTSGTAASVEVGRDELTRLHNRSVRDTITAEFKKLGYTTVHFDPEGYSMGKLNRSV